MAIRIEDISAHYPEPNPPSTVLIDSENAKDIIRSRIETVHLRGSTTLIDMTDSEFGLIPPLHHKEQGYSLDRAVLQDIAIEIMETFGLNTSANRVFYRNENHDGSVDEIIEYENSRKGLFFQRLTRKERWGKYSRVKWKARTSRSSS